MASATRPRRIPDRYWRVTPALTVDGGVRAPGHGPKASTLTHARVTDQLAHFLGQTVWRPKSV